jgi:aminopeptidase N
VVVDEEVRDGQRVSTIAAGPARDFFLAASPRYEVISKTVDGVKFSSYSRPELAEGAAKVLESAIAAVDRFEELVGPYPYTELDLVETATAAAGVEYPGLAAIAGRLYEGDRMTLLEPVTVHEAAHQWFYNAVGNDQVDEPWLDESLVQYLTMRYYGDVYGRQGYRGFRDSLVERWNRVDQQEIPVGLPVEAYDGTSYSAIVYGRGALFFEALQEAMGEQAFEAFLQDYYRENEWGVVTTESFKRLAEQSCQCDLTELFETWIYAR